MRVAVMCDDAYLTLNRENKGRLVAIDLCDCIVLL